MNETSRHPDLSALIKELPPYVARNHPRLKELTGYSGRYLANLDALKPSQGPPKRIMLGNTVAYERETFVRWLESRSRVIMRNRVAHTTSSLRNKKSPKITQVERED